MVQKKVSSHKSYAGTMFYSIYWLKMWDTIYWIYWGRGGYLTTFLSEKFIGFSYNNFHFLVVKHFDAKQKEIQHSHMLTHDEYIYKLITI